MPNPTAHLPTLNSHLIPSALPKWSAHRLMWGPSGKPRERRPGWKNSRWTRVNADIASKYTR